MHQSLRVPPDVRSILVTRLDALGDIVMGTMLLSGLHARWPDARITLVVRPQFAAVGDILPDWINVAPLAFDPRLPIAGEESQIIEHLRAFAAAHRAELAIMPKYNRVWAGDIIAQTCGAADILGFAGPTGLNFTHRDICRALGATDQLPAHFQAVSVDAESPEHQKYHAFLYAMGMDVPRFEPAVVVREEDRAQARALWHQTGIDPDRAIILFPSSGEHLVRSLSEQVWVHWIGRLRLIRPVVMFGSEADLPVLAAIEKCGLPADVKRVVVPPERIGLAAAFIERGGVYIGMDTGPMHIAAALGRPTLGVFGGGHNAERFLPVGRRAAAIRMPLGCYGCDWLCPFDTRLCIKSIPEWPLFEAGDAFLNDIPDNTSPFVPRTYHIEPPAELPAVLLGPIMRQHRRFLVQNHELVEHHAYLARTNADVSTRLDHLRMALENLSADHHARGQSINDNARALSDMTRLNTARDQAIALLSSTLAEMTRHNESRDAAIAHLSDSSAQMTAQNQSRDLAIHHLSEALAEMTRRNGDRDAAIAHINATLAEMTRQNTSRDLAISLLSGEKVAAAR